jgi:hypothetical protein
MSSNYDLFELSMRLRRPIFCMYGCYPRELCPIILGHSQGEEKALTYNSGVKASRGWGEKESGAASGCRRSAKLACMTGLGTLAPITTTSKDASRRSTSM